ncbi:uncharacterized protein ASCRUDRAFT_81002 [Ascoidea rubescens DSM 1968]|uniref:Uncharacterized protein n=1 Tax=Ascoidea rubescens DSM 1968 TaxID=1344418 RepID=A0A1D2VI11_9ASCO|nr:hypothetical protein ASCRUDRAFT_81002 [Ascoidea rubescens DSM 1968]ODV61286.1 hypothetical protein ASCRUDRAFT_81002 [Ascoidea rubescens DSM 1968]
MKNKNKNKNKNGNEKIELNSEPSKSKKESLGNGSNGVGNRNRVDTSKNSDNSLLISLDTDENLKIVESKEPPKIPDAFKNILVEHQHSKGPHLSPSLLTKLWTKLVVEYKPNNEILQKTIWVEYFSDDFLDDFAIDSLDASSHEEIKKQKKRTRIHDPKIFFKAVCLSIRGVQLFTYPGVENNKVYVIRNISFREKVVSEGEFRELLAEIIQEANKENYSNKISDIEESSDRGYFSIYTPNFNTNNSSDELEKDKVVNGGNESMKEK